MLDKVLRLALLIPLAPLLFAFVYVAFLYLQSVPFDQIQSFVFAYLIAFLVWAVSLSLFRFWANFQHEMAHLTWSKLLGGEIKKLLVTVEEDSEIGGEVVATRGNTFFFLAPYFFPFFTGLFLLTKPFVASGFNDIFNALIGITLAFHHVTVLVDFRLRQDDIKNVGSFFAIIMTFILNVIVLIIVLAVVLNDYNMIFRYISDSFDYAVLLYYDIWLAWQSGAIAQGFNNFLHSIGL